MPIHPHHRAECLEPEWVTQPRKKPAYTVFQDNVLGNTRAKLCHPIRKPRRDASSVERQIGGTGTSHVELIARVLTDQTNGFSITSVMESRISLFMTARYSALHFQRLHQRIARLDIERVGLMHSK